KSYGSLGAVMILLIWFYVTGFAFMIGGVINAQIEHAAASGAIPKPRLPAKKQHRGPKSVSRTQLLRYHCPSRCTKHPSKSEGFRSVCVLPTRSLWACCSGDTAAFFAPRAAGNCWRSNYINH